MYVFAKKKLESCFLLFETAAEDNFYFLIGDLDLKLADVRNKGTVLPIYVGTFSVIVGFSSLFK